MYNISNCVSGCSKCRCYKEVQVNELIIMIFINLISSIIEFQSGKLPYKLGNKGLSSDILFKFGLYI